MNKEHKKRIEKLQSHGKNFLFINSGMEANDPNFFYYTGLDVDYGALWIPSNGEPVVMLSEMDAQKYPKIGFTNNIPSKLKLLKGRKSVYLNYDNMRMTQGMRIKNSNDGSSILKEIRSIKSKKEIDIIRQNAEISERIIKSCKVFGRSETDIAADINFKFNKLGGEQAYPTIVAGDKNTSSPHHTPTNQKIKDICYIDAGIRRNGYVSDVTRSFVSEKHQKYLDMILASIKSAEDLLSPGVKIADVDAAARKSLGDYQKYFIHSLGHGIGLDVHEAPGIWSGDKNTLKEGMVITIEPGIYIKTFGLRVENDYVITKNGFKMLTKTVN